MRTFIVASLISLVSISDSKACESDPSDALDDLASVPSLVFPMCGLRVNAGYPNRYHIFGTDGLSYQILAAAESVRDGVSEMKRLVDARRCPQQNSAITLPYFSSCESRIDSTGNYFIVVGRSSRDLKILKTSTKRKDASQMLELLSDGFTCPNTEP